MSDEQKWLPVDWMDEYVPDPQNDPNSFICHDAEHGWFLRPVEEKDATFGDGYYPLTLSEGQVVKFSAFINYGDFALTIRDDRSFETDRDIPEKANCFRVDRDTDTLQPSLGELVSCGGGLFGEMEPGTHAIDAYWWSEEEYAFTFSIVDGTGQLAPAGVVQ